MFRIKNVRNATVAKQEKVPPSINRDLQLPNPKPTMGKGGDLRRNAAVPSQTKNIPNVKATIRPNPKLSLPNNKNKVQLISNAHV